MLSIVEPTLLAGDKSRREKGSEWQVRNEAKHNEQAECCESAIALFTARPPGTDTLAVWCPAAESHSLKTTGNGVMQHGDPGRDGAVQRNG